MNFYTMAGAIGVALGIIWVVFLLVARALLRAYRIPPNAIFTVFTVGLVLALMVAAYHVSDYCLAAVGMTAPKDVITFRRIWIAIWALAMIASIQIFLDIRRMAQPGPRRTAGPNSSDLHNPQRPRAQAAPKRGRNSKNARNRRP
ncbi:MAG: hypothetical protein ACREQN_12010 [Candidatus Binataceae bacterium]